MSEEATANEDPDTNNPSDNANSQPNTDATKEEGTPKTVSKESDSSPEPSIDKISESLTDDGFDVFHGREFITIREDGQLAPNSTVVEEYLADTEAVMLAYNGDDNEIALIPLEQEYDRGDVYAYTNGHPIAARSFLKENGLESDETIRYPPEWDDDIGGEHVDGGFRIDLDQDGEVVTVDASESDTGSDTADDAATADQ